MESRRAPVEGLAGLAHGFAVGRELVDDQRPAASDGCACHEVEALSDRPTDDRLNLLYHHHQVAAANAATVLARLGAAVGQVTGTCGVAGARARLRWRRTMQRMASGSASRSKAAGGVVSSTLSCWSCGGLRHGVPRQVT